MDGHEKSEAKIIAQFHIVDKPSALEQFLDNYKHCPLCSSELVYTHVTNFINERVQEEAFCMACNIRTKSGEHGLQ